MSRRKTANKLKREGQTMTMVFATIIVAVIIVVVVVASNGLKTELKEIQKEQARITAEITVQQQRKEDIEDYRKYMQTKQYIEDMAKEKAGLVYPDEYIFAAED